MPLTLPPNLQSTLVSYQADRKISRWERVIVSGQGAVPTYALPANHVAVLSQTDHPLHLPLLRFLHENNLHLYCACQSDSGATSHVKLREGHYFFARNASSPEHHPDCVLFNPRHDSRAPEQSPDAGEPSTDLLERTLIQLIRAAGADTWTPKKTPLRGKDWVEAAHGLQVAPHVPLPWFFKTRPSYLPDLRGSLTRNAALFDGSEPLGMLLFQSDKGPSVTGKVDAQGGPVDAGDYRTLGDLGNCPIIGLLGVLEEGTRGAVLAPVAGKKQRFPVSNDREAAIVGLLMAKGYFWAGDERYGRTITLRKLWGSKLATFQVSSDEGHIVSIFLREPDSVAGSETLFEARYGEQGLVVDHELGLAEQQRLVESFVFKKLVAKRGATASAEA